MENSRMVWVSAGAMTRVLTVAATVASLATIGCNRWDLDDAAISRCVSYTTDAYVRAALKIDEMEAGKMSKADLAGARRLELAKDYANRWCSLGGSDAIAEMIRPCTEYPFGSDSALKCIEERANYSMIHPKFFAAVDDYIASKDEEKPPPGE